MAKSTSISTTSVDTESITFGEGISNVQYYGRGATVEGLGNEGVAALSTGFTEISKAALQSQVEQSEKGLSTIEKGLSTIENIVGNLQTGTEQALSGIDKAYAKSVSGTAALESLKPYIVGALALGAVAILSGAMRK